VADDEAQEIHVEVSAHRQILHAEHRVARARDVEGGIVEGLRNAHGALQLGCRMGNRSRARFREMESARAANSACLLFPFAGGRGGTEIVALFLAWSAGCGGARPVAWC